MRALTDNDIMPFGKYQKSKTKMANVPASYFEWFKYTNEGKELKGLSKLVMDYINDNWHVIEAELAKEETNRVVRRMLSRRG